ncbi:CoA-substrate-specific enzyme activase, putative [Thermodesulfobium acidiphilum]|uniref:CoA-substrate-specific enzyme activase, putative n=1 Tax=Thermodesulfobium acidiphilum TaxID=1794699 RepID=A0A2R4W2E6_THEAF|nr:acyl-CoA dehydratase activase [Thermodesulfobium acidiphilum]AWB10878.1 CoA-substrate-specific enzyme activase, putative [Thermodesulfobium acidiphilum]PMP85323.1 MAG: CoA activase [Thermodesulfobium narugense]
MKILGLDIGSRSIKWVLYETSFSCILEKGILDSTPHSLERIEEIIPSFDKIGLTGYGRHNLNNVLRTKSPKIVSEITCHAKGAKFIEPGHHYLLDIGGQDTKFITLDASGKIIDFKLNDRCSAGTGRYIENMAKILDLEIQDFINMAIKSEKPSNINSMCTVFAESEIISLIHSRERIEDISAGIIKSLIFRTKALIGTNKIDEKILLLGGLSELENIEILFERFDLEVKKNELSRYTGALGAALVLVD